MQTNSLNHTLAATQDKAFEINMDKGVYGSFAEIGAKAEDIPAMVAHRAERPNGFPFGNFIKIGPDEMSAIMQLAANR